MARTQFTFVQALPLGRSRREHELEQAKARSHAAKISHRRSKVIELEHEDLLVAVARKHESEAYTHAQRTHGGNRIWEGNVGVAIFQYTDQAS